MQKASYDHEQSGIHCDNYNASKQLNISKRRQATESSFIGVFLDFYL